MPAILTFEYSNPHLKSNYCAAAVALLTPIVSLSLLGLKRARVERFVSQVTPLRAALISGSSSTLALLWLATHSPRVEQRDLPETPAPPAEVVPTTPLEPKTWEEIQEVLRPYGLSRAEMPTTTYEWSRYIIEVHKAATPYRERVFQLLPATGQTRQHPLHRLQTWLAPGTVLSDEQACIHAWRAPEMVEAFGHLFELRMAALDLILRKQEACGRTGLPLGHLLWKQATMDFDLSASLYQVYRIARDFHAWQDDENRVPWIKCTWRTSPSPELARSGAADPFFQEGTPQRRWRRCYNEFVRRSMGLLHLATEAYNQCSHHAHLEPNSSRLEYLLRLDVDRSQVFDEREAIYEDFRARQIATTTEEDEAYATAERRVASIALTI